MLNKDVIDHCKNSWNYFQVLKCYVQSVSQSSVEMIYIMVKLVKLIASALQYSF